MDINLSEAIQQYLQISIVLVCLFVGYIIKTVVSNERVHKFIPRIVGIIGLIAAIWVDCGARVGVSLDTIVTGLASGLASTGLYELFNQLITKLPALDEDYEDIEVKGDHFAD